MNNNNLPTQPRLGNVPCGLSLPSLIINYFISKMFFDVLCNEESCLFVERFFLRITMCNSCHYPRFWSKCDQNLGTTNPLQYISVIYDNHLQWKKTEALTTISFCNSIVWIAMMHRCWSASRYRQLRKPLQMIVICCSVSALLHIVYVSVFSFSVIS